MQEQLDIAEKQRSRSAMAALLTNLGILQVEHGEDDLAFDSFTRGMTLSEEIGNKQLISIAMGCIGGVWERRNDFKKALDLYQRDLDLCLELGDQQGTAICYGLLGNLFAKQGKYKKAIKHLRENMTLCKRLKYAKGVIKARKDMASILVRQGKSDKALRQYEKAIAKARSTENRLLLAQCLLDVCRVKLDSNQYTNETTEHVEAFELSARLGNASLQINAGIILARVHAHNGERDIAISVLDDLRLQTLTPAQRTEIEAISASL
jgi:tetratricopeptide (TPR) repeat protein